VWDRGSWFVWPGLCSGEQRSSSWTRRQQPLIWIQTTSFNKQYEKNSKTLPWLRLLIGSIQSSIPRGKKSFWFSHLFPKPCINPHPYFMFSESLSWTRGRSWNLTLPKIYSMIHTLFLVEWQGMQESENPQHLNPNWEKFCYILHSVLFLRQNVVIIPRNKDHNTRHEFKCSQMKSIKLICLVQKPARHIAIYCWRGRDLFSLPGSSGTHSIDFKINLLNL